MKYRAIYMKLQQLRGLASYTNPSNAEEREIPLDISQTQNGIESHEVTPAKFVRTWFKKSGLDVELDPFGFNVDMFTEELFSKYGEFYLPVRGTTLLSVNPRLKGDQSVSSLADISNETTTSTLALSFKMSATTSKGRSVTISSVCDKVTFFPTLAFPVIKAYIYADVYKFYGKLTSILNRATSRAAQLLTAYNAIPTSGEQFTDETVTTPNLETENVNMFDPIKSAGYGMGDRSKVTQKGTQTTTIKRAANISAREQVEIVRNLPNIFTDCMNEIGELLVDPRTVQDMYDWGLADGCWIDD